jgi:hypothetical protein
MGSQDKQAAATSPKAGDRPALLILDMVNCFDFEGAEAL